MDEKYKWSMQYNERSGAKLSTDNSVWPYSSDFLLNVYLNEDVSKLPRFTERIAVRTDWLDILLPPA